MKYVLIGCIRVYQLLPFESHKKCKFIPTCSNYGIEAINKYGSIKGSILTLKRILRCNPFTKGGYDPLMKENKNEQN